MPAFSTNLSRGEESHDKLRSNNLPRRVDLLVCQGKIRMYGCAGAGGALLHGPGAGCSCSCSPVAFWLRAAVCIGQRGEIRERERERLASSLREVQLTRGESRGAYNATG